MNAIATFYQTLYVLGQICLFRAKPTALPFSWFMLALVVILDFVLEFYRLPTFVKNQPNIKISFVECCLGAGLSAGGLIGMSYFLLAKQQIVERIYKFLVAFIGVRLVFAVFLQLLASVSNNEQPTAMQTIAHFWHLAIQIQIIQFTFTVKLFRAVFLLFCISFATSLPLWLIINMNLPPQQ